MRRQTIASGLVAGALLVIGGAAVVAHASVSPVVLQLQENTDSDLDTATDAPPTPPWVRPDGTINNAAVPTTIPVVGPNGELVRNADGSLKMVPFNVGNLLEASEEEGTYRRYIDEDGNQVEEVIVRMMRP